MTPPGIFPHRVHGQLLFRVVDDSTGGSDTLHKCRPFVSVHPQAAQWHASGEIASWFDGCGSGTTGCLGNDGSYLVGQLRRRVRFVNESKMTSMVEPWQDVTDRKSTRLNSSHLG